MIETTDVTTTTRSAMRIPRAATLLLATAALAVAFAGCGGDDGDSTGADGAGESFDLALDFFVNPDHVGIYQALDTGYFADEGLDVHPRVPSDPAAPIKQVAAGQVDLAISYEPEVMLARDQGIDVVAVGAIVHGPLTSLISLPEAGIDGPADLAGKTVVTAGIPYQSAYLETILDDAGVDPGSVDEVNVGFNLLPAVLSGRGDAMLGGFLNVEGVQLAERGADPKVVPVNELGIPTYDELVLVASGDEVRENPERIEAFLSALQRGTEDAIADPDPATDALLAASDGLDPDLTRKEVAATLPRLESPAGKPFGFMDPAEWDAFGIYLDDQGQLDSVPTAEELLTNDLLPPPKE
ncbi:MAG: ABC transporter substrate-binding protein [Solirubrobacterales bacterium]|nr:ABC transporter substrate-binding protein [Solirubrobacterales bacterium]